MALRQVKLEHCRSYFSRSSIPAGWDRDGRGAPPAELQNAFRDALAGESFLKPLGAIIEGAAAQLRIARLLAIHVFRYLAWHRLVEVDPYVPLHLTKPHPALASNFRGAVR
ncbi:MAG: hypothetical protein CPSOU_6550 [uncultured Paraburkholderia sp.]|nr:MAG: hypothetical protein CPSOU_6550 [uncultured Paraburkholderia sp.]